MAKANVDLLEKLKYARQTINGNFRLVGAGEANIDLTVVYLKGWVNGIFSNPREGDIIEEEQAALDYITKEQIAILNSKQETKMTKLKRKIICTTGVEVSVETNRGEKSQEENR